MPAVGREGRGTSKGSVLVSGLHCLCVGEQTSTLPPRDNKHSFVIFAKAAVRYEFGDGLQAPTWITLSSCRQRQLCFLFKHKPNVFVTLLSKHGSFATWFMVLLLKMQVQLLLLSHLCGVLKVGQSHMSIFPKRIPVY